MPSKLGVIRFNAHSRTTLVWAENNMTEPNGNNIPLHPRGDRPCTLQMHDWIGVKA